jgi:hypothetical protein
MFPDRIQSLGLIMMQDNLEQNFLFVGHRNPSFGLFIKILRDILPGVNVFLGFDFSPSSPLD